MTIQQARADIEVIARQLAKVYPKNYPKNFSVEIISWVDSLVGQFPQDVVHYRLGCSAAACCLVLIVPMCILAAMLGVNARALDRTFWLKSVLWCWSGSRRKTRSLILTC